MNIKIYQDRYTETCCVPGTQFEQNATVIKFDFSELDFIDDECIKTIHFFCDDLSEENYIGDSIIQNDEFKIPKSITEYENVLAFIQITKSDFIWKTKSFDLHFNQSLDVDKTLDEDQIGILQELVLEVQQIKTDTADEYKQLAEEETKKFNDNATAKTNTFNSNATSKETSYNENATAKLNEYNENHTAKLNAYNENSADKIAEYDEHIEDLDNIVSKNVASGESILVDDALAYKVFGAKVDGNVKQTTTTGKQMLQMCVETRTQNGVTFIKNADGSVTLDGTATAGTFCNLNTSYDVPTNKKYFTLEKGKTYTSYCKNITSNIIFSTRSNSQNTALLSSGAGNEIASQSYEGETDTECYSYLYVRPGVAFDNYTVYPMVCEGAYTELEWEEYTGGEASPNPDYPQMITTLKDSMKIVQKGKNLFNNVNYGHLGFWVQTAGQNTTMSSNNSYLSAYCKVVAGKTYTVSRQILSNRFAIAACDEVPNVNTTALVLAVDSDAKSLTVTVPNGYSYLVMYLQNDGTYEDVRLQIEEGSVATDYEEYKSNEYDIDLQDNELAKLTDVMKDDIVIDKIGNATLNKRVGKTILNGTENWFLSNAGTYQVFGLTKNDVAKNNLLSDTFIYYKQVNLIKDRVGITNDNTEQRIYISNGISSTVEEFKAWLSENNVTVYYELLEHQTTNIGTFTNFKTFEGINSFFLETNIGTNFEVTYAQDLQKKTEDLQAQIDELKTLLSSTATSALLLDNYASDLVSEIESEV